MADQAGREQEEAASGRWCALPELPGVPQSRLLCSAHCMPEQWTALVSKQARAVSKQWKAAGGERGAGRREEGKGKERDGGGSPDPSVGRW